MIPRGNGYAEPFLMVQLGCAPEKFLMALLCDSKMMESSESKIHSVVSVYNGARLLP